LRQATEASDVLEELRARAAIASISVLARQPDAGRRVQELVTATEARAVKLDAIYPPATTELHLLAGLLAASQDDALLVASALRRVQSSVAVRDYPTLAQLQQVLLAEQERLGGNPQAGVARLRPIIKRDDALVVAHWGLMRAERAAGNADASLAQAQWLATHRGRTFAESTTTEVLRFFNVAVSNQARVAQSGQQSPTEKRSDAG